jgi:hypothetical protein
MEPVDVLRKEAEQTLKNYNEMRIKLNKEVNEFNCRKLDWEFGYKKERDLIIRRKNTLDKAETDLKIRYADADKLYSDARKKFELAKDLEESVNKKYYKEIDKNKKFMADLEVKHAKLSSEIAKLEEKRKIGMRDIKKHEQELEKEKNKLSKWAEKLEVKEKVLEKSSVDIAGLLREASSKKKQVQNLRKMIDDLSKRYVDLDKEKLTEFKREEKRLNESISSLNKEFEKLKKERDKQMEPVTKLRSEAESYAKLCKTEFVKKEEWIKEKEIEISLEMGKLYEREKTLKAREEHCNERESVQNEQSAEFEKKEEELKQAELHILEGSEKFDEYVSTTTDRLLANERDLKSREALLEPLKKEYESKVEQLRLDRVKLDSTRAAIMAEYDLFKRKHVL